MDDFMQPQDDSNDTSMDESTEEVSEEEVPSEPTDSDVTPESNEGSEEVM